jgi:hypothetical protein
VAQQRTIETLEAGIAAGGDPELLLDAAEAEDVLQSGTGLTELGPIKGR